MRNSRVLPYLPLKMNAHSCWTMKK